MKTIVTYLGVFSVVVPRVVCSCCDDASALANILNSNTDDDTNIEEPCKDCKGDMYNCVRNFFRYYAECKVQRNPDDKPAYFGDKHYISVPSFNMSYVLVETYLSGLKGVIEKFYINNNTGNLVMSVALKNLFVDTRNMQIIIYRRGREPKVIIEDAYGYYNVVLTAVIDAKNKITSVALDKSLISTYILSIDPTKVYYGPKFLQNQDPMVAAIVQAIMSDLPTAFKEFFLNGGPNVFVAWLQKYICDFGVPLPY